MSTAWSIFGSIFVTVPSRPFATQTKPWPQAIPSGPLPTAMLAIATCLAGSRRETLCAAPFTVQIEPSQAVTVFGDAPTGI